MGNKTKNMFLKVEQLTKDHYTEDAEIRRLAKTVLLDREVDGDAEGVPSAVDIAVMMVKEIERLKAECERQYDLGWREAMETEQHLRFEQEAK